MHTLHLTYSADLQNAHRARQDVVSFLRDVTDEPVWLFNCMLIVDELFMNGVMHGSAHEGAKISVTLEEAGGKMMIEVCDEGNGVSAADIRKRLQEPPSHPYGRGLRVLVQQLADQCYITDLATGGICVRITQDIPDA